MIPINYHHLYYFYTIARAGTISEASKTLLLAQSTLSAQLKLLEGALGGKLFERKRQRLLLTEKGRMVLGYAESIFEMGRELQDAVKDGPRSGRGAVQVGILNGTPRAFGHALIECLLKDPARPHVTVQEGSLGELAAGLGQQKLDVVLSDVSMRRQDQGALLNHLIGKIPVVLAAAPELAGRCKKVPADFDGAPFIPCLGRHLYLTYKRWCDHCGERSPRSLPQFIGTIKNLTRRKAGQPVNTHKTQFSAETISRKMVIPPDELLVTSRNMIAKDGKTQTVWLTECFFAFAKEGEFEC